MTIGLIDIELLQFSVLKRQRKNCTDLNPINKDPSFRCTHFIVTLLLLINIRPVALLIAYTDIDLFRIAMK